MILNPDFVENLTVLKQTSGSTLYALSSDMDKEAHNDSPSYLHEQIRHEKPDQQESV